jgi:hypothetical protein
MEAGVFTFVLAALAVWRVCHLLAREDGPADAIARLRRALGEGFWGRLLDCFHCLSLWVAAPFALLSKPSTIEFFVLWLALSGAACLLERIAVEPVVIEPLPPTADRTQGREK